MPSGEELGNTSRVPVVSQPPGLQVQAGGWVKDRDMSASLLGLGVVAASAFKDEEHESSPDIIMNINIVILRLKEQIS
jgi:hypothetical protein